MKAPNKWAMAGVVALAPALALMDTTIVSVILPQLQQAFQTNFATITWVATAYFLAQAAVIPITGYLSDRLGSKPVFLTAVALFTLGSALCALAPTKEALFTFRVVQGIGGGALVPMSYAIIFRIFPPSQRGFVSAVISFPILLAPAFGPTIGGYLSTSFNWNAVFIINLPIGVIDLLLCFLLLQSDRRNASVQSRASDLHAANPSQLPLPKATWKHFDISGLLLSITGFTILVYSIAQAGSLGWSDATVLTSLLIGIALLAVFVAVELRVSDPVLDLRLFMNATFTLSNSLLWFVISVFFGGLFLLPLFFENVGGNTALTTGTFLIGQGLGLGVGTTVAGVLYNRMGPRLLTVFGLLLLIGGTYGVTQIDVHTTGQALQIWLVLRGLGAGFVYQPIQTLSLSVVSNKGMAKASSLVNVMRQVATAAVVASLTTYLTEQTTAHGVGIQAVTAGMVATFWLILILGALCLPLALLLGDDPALKAQKREQVSGAAVKMSRDTDEIAAFHPDLNPQGNAALALNSHSSHLQGSSRVVSTNLQASTPALSSLGVSLGNTLPKMPPFQRPRTIDRSRLVKVRLVPITDKIEQSSFP